MSDQTKRIHITMGAGQGRFEVGGHDLSTVTRAITLRFEAGGVPEITAELAVLDGDIDGEATVRIPAKTREALIALGWTPPQD